MRLLILTQKVDKNDDVLGFFHGWVEKLSEHFESIIVVCLEKGEHSLPLNVKVLSLGKEASNFQFSIFNFQSIFNFKIFKKVKYLTHFYKYIWKFRKKYDKVFVHMNQEYVLLGGIFWRLWGKKLFLWRNHKKGNILTRIAVALSQKVFYTSPQSFTARSKKGIKMPVGINTDKFKKQETRFDREARRAKNKIQNSILSLGRISPVKRLEILIEAMKKLDKDIVLDIVGASTEKDKNYYDELSAQGGSASGGKKEAGENVNFLGSVDNKRAPDLYNSHELFINLTLSGSFDKTIIEAMACESLVLVANKSLEEILSKEFLFEGDNLSELADKIENLLEFSEEQKAMYGKKFREYVIKNHSLDLLIKKLYEQIH